MVTSKTKPSSAPFVSVDSEELILVNRSDEQVGFMAKDKCHDGDGLLHRAFSVFVFNERGQLLLQQRSAQKRLWPLFWSNSCCGHPRRGESMRDAVPRRLLQELQMTCELRYLFKFIYRANFAGLGSEHECCSVYAGISSDSVQANTHEINSWRYVTPEQLDRQMKTRSQIFTPWAILEWERIRRDFRDIAAAL